MAATCAEIGQLKTKYEYDLPFLERVESLRDVILEGGDRAQQLRCLPDDTVDILIDHGLFRFALPIELGGENASVLETTKIARLACVHATNVCMHAVDLLHNTAGTSGMRMDSPLERKLRDAHGCANHRWVSHPLYSDLGRIFLGFEPSPEMAGD